LLASASWDTTVRLWDPRTGHPVGQPLSGHGDFVWSVAFSPDGKLLASAGNDGAVRLWDPATGQPVDEPHTIRHVDDTTIDGSELPPEIVEDVASVAFSPDGSLLATSGWDTRVRLWNPTTGQPVGDPLVGHTDVVWSVAFSPDDQVLASAGNDGAVRLWDPGTGEPVGEPLTGHGTVWSVAFSPDGELLASAGGDGLVRLWDPATGQPVGEPIPSHHGVAKSVAFSADGNLLAIGAGDTVTLFPARWTAAVVCPVAEPYVSAATIARMLPPQVVPTCDYAR
jgi:WD40 repeat protein